MTAALAVAAAALRGTRYHFARFSPFSSKRFFGCFIQIPHRRTAHRRGNGQSPRPLQAAQLLRCNTCWNTGETLHRPPHPSVWHSSKPGGTIVDSHAHWLCVFAKPGQTGSQIQNNHRGRVAHYSFNHAPPQGRWPSVCKA